MKTIAKFFNSFVAVVYEVRQARTLAQVKYNIGR
jgi:hypothetical protein